MLDTLSNVKARLGITNADSDVFLTAQISLISDVIEAYCGRKFPATNWIQTFYREEIRDPRSVELYHYPVITLTKVEIDEVPMDDDTFGDILIHKPTARLRRKDGGWIYGEEVAYFYRAGYETIPSPILSVLDSLVQERYNKRISGVDLNFGSDVQRVSIPGTISVDFDYSLTSNSRQESYGSIIGSQANVLDPWRSERAVVGSGKLEFVEEDT